MIPLIWGIQNSQMHRNREYNSDFQGLEVEGNRELLLSVSKVSVMLDEYVLEICCTTKCL